MEGDLISNVVIFDLETQRTFQEVGGRRNLHRLGLAAAVTYSLRDGQFHHYLEQQAADLVAELKAADLVVGYNVIGFDYAVLQPYTQVRLRQLPTLDMMLELERALGFRLGLDSVASATLGTRKSADGLQAVRWYRQGKLDQVLAYCQQDVEVTRQLYEFGRDNGWVAYWDRRRGVKRRVPVNWRRR